MCKILKRWKHTHSPEWDTLGLLYLYGVSNSVSVIIVEDRAWKQWEIHCDTFGCPVERGGVLWLKGEGQHGKGVPTYKPLFRLRGQMSRVRGENKSQEWLRETYS